MAAGWRHFPCVRRIVGVTVRSTAVLRCALTLVGAAIATSAFAQPVSSVVEWTGTMECKSSSPTEFESAVQDTLRLVQSGQSLSGAREWGSLREAFEGSLHQPTGDGRPVSLTANGSSGPTGRKSQFQGAGVIQGDTLRISGIRTLSAGGLPPRRTGCEIVMRVSSGLQAAQAQVAPAPVWTGNDRLASGFDVPPATELEDAVNRRTEETLRELEEAAARRRPAGAPATGAPAAIAAVPSAPPVLPPAAAAQRSEPSQDQTLAALAAEVAALRAQLARPAVDSAPRPTSGRVVAAANRRALVIGNDAYKHVMPLENAVSDARAMAEQLRTLGYKVNLQTNVTEKQLRSALRAFKGEVQPGDEVTVFYAGHGVQLGQTNFLLPVDVQGDSEEQLRDDAIPLDRLLDDMQDSKARFTLAIVDACRDNPFKVRGSRALGGLRGLAPTAAATGQMIVFSAGAGQKALDRLGAGDRNRNSVFTRVLLQEMLKPGLRVDEVVRNVRAEVVELARSVGHEQVPAIYDQAVGSFFFKP